MGRCYLHLRWYFFIGCRPLHIIVWQSPSLVWCLLSWWSFKKQHTTLKTKSQWITSPSKIYFVWIRKTTFQSGRKLIVQPDSAWHMVPSAEHWLREWNCNETSAVFIAWAFAHARQIQAENKRGTLSVTRLMQIQTLLRDKNKQSKSDESTWPEASW